MTNLAQSQKTTQDKASAKFDVALSLPPVNTDLNSEYFQEYLKQVAKTGNTPF
jgi:dihydrodipicolinate synthase/N-acetylneuraminate lyase